MPNWEDPDDPMTSPFWSTGSSVPWLREIRWGARLVLLTVVVSGLAFVVFLISELYSGLE